MPSRTENDSELSRFCPPAHGRKEWVRDLTLPGADVIDLTELLPGLIVPKVREARTELAIVKRDLTKPTTHPRRNKCMCLLAAYGRHIYGFTTVQVHHQAGYQGDPQVINHALDTERSRSAARLIRDGNQLWSDLGAWWPWAPDDCDWSTLLAEWHKRSKLRYQHRLAMLQASIAFAPRNF